MKKLPLLLAIFFITTAFNPPQPAAERKAQEALPQASGDIWDKLGAAKINFDDKKNIFTASVPQNVKALSGSEVTVNGFMLPLQTETKQTHFLLSKRTPTCPYCMPGGPSEVIDIYLKDPITYTDGVIYITGKFQFIDDTKSGLFFRLNNASAKVEEPMFKTKSPIGQPPV